LDMCQPYKDELKLYEGSSFVDDAKHEGVQCISPAGDHAEQINLIYSEDNDAPVHGRSSN